MKLAGEEQAGHFERTLENPLTNVVNPGKEKMEIEELEEQLRTGQIPQTQMVDKIVLLAKKYTQIGQREKAVEYLGKALRQRNRPDAEILNQMAINYGEMGDHQREEKFYREAALASSWFGPWFNLALAQKKQGRVKEAVESLEKALGRDRLSPCLVLRAQLAEALEKKEEHESYLKEALESFGPISGLSDWELGWLYTAAQMAGDLQKTEEADAERRRRAGGAAVTDPSGVLPGNPEGLQEV